MISLAYISFRSLRPAENVVVSTFHRVDRIIVMCLGRLHESLLFISYHVLLVLPLLRLLALSDDDNITKASHTILRIVLNEFDTHSVTCDRVDCTVYVDESRSDD